MENTLTENKNNTLKNISSDLIFYFSILIFIIGFNFSDNPPPTGWYQQFMPFINNRPISDITFLDSLTGYAVTPYTANDTAYILKTLNGGDNWNIIFKGHTSLVNGFNRIQFININTGFVASGAGIFKTINAGINWTLITNQVYARDMFVLNNDTIWTVDEEPLAGGVFRTTDGGNNWTRQINLGPGNPDKIYMFNSRIGFISRSAQLRKTTNGGQTWTLMTGTGTGSFSDIFFIDSLTGWKAKEVGGGGWLMGKSTDGGFNWIEQTLPTGGNISSGSEITRFDNIVRDTIWGCGGVLFYPSIRAFLYRTINGGTNWLFQVPDTSFQITSLSYIDFTDKNHGWSYMASPRGIHTTTGGNDTFYTSIGNINSSIPNDYILYQNYPNPFNNSTIIKYKISKSSDIKITLYDITGKEVRGLINGRRTPGEYETGFDAGNISSGIYFYSLFADDKLIDTKKLILIK